MKSTEKTKSFSVGSSKPGRIILKKLEDEQKKKKEEEHTQEVFKEFVATFEGDSKTRTWIKGGVVNPGSRDEPTGSPTSGRIYKPVSKLEEKSSKPDTPKPEAKKSAEKPPSLGKRRGQEQKKSKLEQFKEELKLIQQQREQRHALRQNKTSPLPNVIQSELDLSDVSRGRDYRNSACPAAYGPGNFGPGNFGPMPNATNFVRRGQRDRRDDYPYDFDGDQTTTNLFLGNLNPKMTEQQLCEAFGRYGPLASVKIMWPRTDEERSRGRNCGFVAFMNRRDGERALDNIRGKELMGFEMKLGWGKSVPIPLYPIYIPPALLELIKPPPPSGLPFNAQPREWLKSLRLAIKERAKLVTDGTDSDTSIPPGPDRKPFDISKMGRDELNEVLKDAVVKVVIPSDRSVLALIHRLIEFVVLEGPQFEAAIMHREQNNPQFKFLFDYQSSEHAYYRWKLWSILHGESVNNWRTDEFRMFECGPLWRPPPMNLFSGGMPEDLVEEDDYPYAPGYVPPPQARRHRDADVMFDEMYSEAMAASRRCGLTEAQRGRFTQMLIDLEPSRSNIGDVMVWCLEHADSAADIACCVVESLSPNCPFLKTETAEKTDATKIDEPDVTSDEKTEAHSPISKTIARLFLISDILYNSSAKVPNASYFRKCFQDLLPGVFTNLHATYKNVEGKLKAEQLKQKVMLCFRAWEDWAVYPNDYLIRLQNIFLGLVSQDDDDADLSGVPLDYDPSGGLEIPGKRFNATDSNVEILEAQPLVQYDGDPLDVDGSPLGADEPPEKSIASRPPTQTVPKPVSTMASDPSASRLFVPSKWETVDPETVEAEAVTTTSRWELLVDSTPQHSTSPGSARTTNDRKETTNWRQNSNAADDDDLDGQPLIGLVAYDDEDAASSVSSEPDSIPLPSSAPPPLPSTTVADSSLKQASSVGTSSVPTNTLSEERRARLRDIELKVLRYQDELESSRKGDKSITEEAINKQIQRYRERLLERLNEDAAVSPVPSKSHSTHSKSRNSKSSKGGSSSLSANLKQSLNESSISPPSRRDSRDRSPPRSFRERDRVRRRAPSPNSPLAVIDSYDSPSYRVQQSGNYGSPYIRSRMSTSGWDQDNDDFERRSRGNSIRASLPREDLEEGEASDEEDSGFMYAQLASRRKHGVDDKQSPSLRHFRKRQRSHSPDSPDARQHSYRSRTPSPSRKRSGVSLSTNNSGHKRKL